MHTGPYTAFVTVVLFPDRCAKFEPYIDSVYVHGGLSCGDSFWQLVCPRMPSHVLACSLLVEGVDNKLIGHLLDCGAGCVLTGAVLLYVFIKPIDLFLVPFPRLITDASGRKHIFD